MADRDIWISGDIQYPSRAITDARTGEPLVLVRGDDMDFHIIARDNAAIKSLGSGTIYLEVKSTNDPDEVPAISESGSIDTGLTLAEAKAFSNEHALIQAATADTEGLPVGTAHLVVWAVVGGEKLFIVSGPIKVEEPGADDQGIPNYSADKFERQSNKGVPSGYAPLGSDGNIDGSYTNYPATFTPKGPWNVSTNTPNLAGLTPTVGDAYRVDVGGTSSLTGSSVDWVENDYAIYTSAGWDRQPRKLFDSIIPFDDVAAFEAATASGYVSGVTKFRIGGTQGGDFTAYTVTAAEALLNGIDLSGSGSVAVGGVVFVPSGESVSTGTDIVAVRDDWKFNLSVEHFSTYQNAVETAALLDGVTLIQNYDYIHTPASTPAIDLRGLSGVTILAKDKCKILMHNMSSGTTGTTTSHGVLVSDGSNAANLASDIKLRNMTVRWPSQPTARNNFDGFKIEGIDSTDFNEDISILHCATENSGATSLWSNWTRNLEVFNFTSDGSLADGVFLRNLSKPRVQTVYVKDSGDDGLSIASLDRSTSDQQNAAIARGYDGFACEGGFVSNIVVDGQGTGPGSSSISSAILVGGTKDLWIDGVASIDRNRVLRVEAGQPDGTDTHLAIKNTKLSNFRSTGGNSSGVFFNQEPRFTYTATTISAAASDNSINDSASGFVSTGFTRGGEDVGGFEVGDAVIIQAPSGNTDWNQQNYGIFTVATRTNAKLTFTEDGITDQIAGQTVNIVNIGKAALWQHDLTLEGFRLDVDARPFLASGQSNTQTIAYGVDLVDCILNSDDPTDSANNLQFNNYLEGEIDLKSNGVIELIGGPDISETETFPITNMFGRIRAKEINLRGIRECHFEMLRSQKSQDDGVTFEACTECDVDKVKVVNCNEGGGVSTTTYGLLIGINSAGVNIDNYNLEQLTTNDVRTVEVHGDCNIQKSSVRTRRGSEFYGLNGAGVNTSQILDYSYQNTGASPSSRRSIRKGIETELFRGEVDLNSTSDQNLAMPSGVYQITKILVAKPSASAASAVGGIYAGAGKTGSQIVASSQSYTNLSTASSTLFEDLTLSASAGSLLNAFTNGTLYFSLTTAHGSAVTATIIIFGTWIEDA